MSTNCHYSFKEKLSQKALRFHKKKVCSEDQEWFYGFGTT